jgi:hypothetical protein
LLVYQGRALRKGQVEPMVTKVYMAKFEKKNIVDSAVQFKTWSHRQT